jgi:hypothetical protein
VKARGPRVVFALLAIAAVLAALVVWLRLRQVGE